MRRLLAVFRRPQPAPEPEPEALEPVEEPVEETSWTSSVTFGADGWYYPVLDDDNGDEIGPDFTRPLIHNAKTDTWEFASSEHRSHKEFWLEQHPTGREHELEASE